MRCGICLIDKQELICSHCANYGLLHPKLEYLDLLKEYDDVKSSVNEVLKHCIKGENYHFVKNLLKQGITDTNKNVTVLASQLLTIDVILLKRQNNKIIKEIEQLQEKKRLKKQKIETLKESIKNKKHTSIDNQRLIKLKQDVEIRKQDGKKIIKQINISKSLLFQDLISLYSLKKRKLNSIEFNIRQYNKFIYMLAFTPIISIWNLCEFNNEIINSSLEKMIKFIHQVSNIMLLSLPFDIQLNELRPKLSNFKLYIENDQNIWELSTFELRLFINGFTRIIGNVYVILKELDVIEDGISFTQLMKLDELIYKIGNYDHVINNEPIFEDSKPDGYIQNGEFDIEDLTQRCYELLIKRISKKNNEWHVVKKENL